MNDELPKGWSLTSLDQVQMNLSSSINPAKTPDEKFELYSVPSYETNRPEIIVGREVGSSKRTVTPGTVLLCKINPRINRAWVVGNYSPHLKIASTEWIPFPRVDAVEPGYLRYYLSRIELRDFLASRASGVGGSLMRINLSTLKGYPLPLAPMPEQQRIVAEIQKQFTRLDAAVTALETAQVKLKRYRASVLNAACEGRLVPTEAELARSAGREYERGNALLERMQKERRASWENEQLGKLKAAGKRPKDDRWKSKYKEPLLPDSEALPELPEGWVWASSDQCTARITDGEHLTPERSDGGVLLLSARNVRDGFLLLESVDYVSESVYRTLTKRLKIEAGDVLLSCSGSVGRSCVVPAGLIFALVRSVAVLKPVFDMGSYMSYALRSPRLQAQIAEKKSQTAQANIFQGKIRMLMFPLAPLAEQSRIVSEIDRLLSICEGLQTVIERSLKRAERLRQSVLTRAFEGKLVTQHPGDEPAGILLARIKVEREGADAQAAPGAKSRKKSKAR